MYQQNINELTQVISSASSKLQETNSLAKIKNQDIEFSATDDLIQTENSDVL